jgi:bifunctional aspartokinase / homoserine dehydrogenase 1
MTPRFGPENSLSVFKFGGTSVGDSSCIRKVVEIVHTASHVSRVVVVVSAMSGVTNQLVKAAFEAADGNVDQAAAILNQLRNQHHAALEELISTGQARASIGGTIDSLLEEGARLCQGTGSLRALTPRANDAITSLGERLSVPLLAASLKQRGIASEPLEATDLIVTDSTHGAADPWPDLTRLRCKSRLLPLLDQGIIPVITGFIGATADGILTTLGRGGSDYSAATLGAALDAHEVVIWTDVDGFLTADPRIVPEACTIPEISYREASELALFGAKVLHPKTLRPIVQRGIPLSIRNTFAPEKPGTKITRVGATNGSGVRALTSFADAALITVGGPTIARTLPITRKLQSDVLLIAQSSSQNETYLVVPSDFVGGMVEELRSEFAQDVADKKLVHIAVSSDVAVVSAVGDRIRGMPGVPGRMLWALGRENVDTVPTVYAASECRFSLVIAKKDMQPALAAIHKEFQLGTLSCHSAVEATLHPRPRVLTHLLEGYRVGAD